MNEHENVVTLTIDDQPIGAHGEQSVLEVARENGIDIPTLCHLDGLGPIGACRLCMIEIEGDSRLHPACVTKVEEGQVIHTDTKRVQAHRRSIVEMLFAERNHVCAVCVSNGHCELQNLAQDMGITYVSIPYLHPDLDVDASHPRFSLDHNRCVLCTRCVRVCDEIEGAHTWDVMGRGVEARVITDMGTPWGVSETCTSCGKCVHVCPTGALVEKGHSVAEMHKERQFLPYLTIMRERR
ncbi:MAG TPA: bidirectional hydrogenase complex protein HoxU [Candidatus Krumholzibacteria bacterium]|nr:bidirectional hydrogenase complex protein HoxU [Candidatus Krumholzibacteria bacterium]